MQSQVSAPSRSTRYFEVKNAIQIEIRKWFAENLHQIIEGTVIGEFS